MFNWSALFHLAVLENPEKNFCIDFSNLLPKYFYTYLDTHLTKFLTSISSQTKNVCIHKRATIEGKVFIEEGSRIEEGAFIQGPAWIGKNCLVGRGTQIKRSILLNGVRAPHFNYIGDSIIGNKVNLGAGSVISNLRLNQSDVILYAFGKQWETNRRKFGAFIGDDSQIGANSVICPGVVLNKRTHILPLTCVTRSTI